MTAFLPALLVGWILTACLLIIEHLLWKDTPRVVRYLLGGGALCCGCTVAGIIADDALLAAGPWAIASAGLIIVGWTWHEDRADRERTTVRRSGEVAGMARGLTQELIDAGGPYGERPRHDRAN